MKKRILLFAALASAFFVACSSEQMEIVTGKDFMQNRAAVVDTASVFHSSESFVMQFRYGKNFDFSRLKWEVFDENGKIVASKTSKVNSRDGSYTVVVSSARHGGIASATEFFHAKQGAFSIRFRDADADTLLKEKTVKVILNSEKAD